MHCSTLFSLALLTALSIPAVAHADAITTFQLSGYVQGDATHTVSGTMTVDTTTGVLQNVDFTYWARPASFTAETWFTDVVGGETEIGVTSANPYTGSISGIDLLLPMASLVGYTGGLACSVGNPCDYAPYSTLYQGLSGRNLVDVALTPTPEPSTLALLGTGMLGWIGMAGRKLRASSPVSTAV